MISNIQPLVSIVVYTYNSSETILETLESIKIQKYPRIELVVSDDGSTDDTFNKAFTWVKTYESLFYRAIVIRSHTNMGTCFNYNHGIVNSTGDYIKNLDGDDLLNGEDAIDKYMSYIKSSKGDILMSDVELFSYDETSLEDQRIWYDEILMRTNETLEEQQKRIPIELRIANPGLFFTRSLFEEVGGFDESYKLMEEWPFFYNVIMSGHKIEAIQERLVKYRIRLDSVSHNKVNKTFIVLLNDWNRFFLRTRLPEMIKRKEYKQVTIQLLQNAKKYIQAIINYRLNK